MNAKDEDVQTILDCFSGADGGVGFVGFMGLYAELKKRQSSGDITAGKVITVVRQFARLVRLGVAVQTKKGERK